MSQRKGAVLEDLRKLIQRCLAGQQDAMHALVERYQSQVFGLCYRMLSNREDAEDATQETFVRVLKSLDRWDSARDFDPWLLAIAGNRCRTMLSRRSRGRLRRHWSTTCPTRRPTCKLHKTWPRKSPWPLKIYAKSIGKRSCFFMSRS